MTIRYWKSTRPQEDWLKDFSIDNTVRVSYTGVQETPLTSAQLASAREWVIAFVKSCSSIIQNYTQMLNPEFLAFPLASSSTPEKKIVPNSSSKTSLSLMSKYLLV